MSNTSPCGGRTRACCSFHTSAVAAVHMERNGGSFDTCQDAEGGLTVRVDTCGGTLGPTTVESFTVCHKAGALADVAVMHDVDFGN